MRFSHVLACSLCLPLFVSTFAQSTQQPAASAPQTQPAPTLQLHDLSPEPHTPTPQEQAEQQAAEMRAQLTRIARAQANWGPEESSTGMSLALKEIKRDKTDAGTAITYQLIGKGFTPDMKLTLIRWPLNQNITPVMSGIVMDATGTAVCGTDAAGPQAPTEAAPAAPATQAPSCSKTMKPETPVEITTTAAKGEAIRVALVASDRKHGAALSLVPFPIEGDNQGCKIQVLLGSKDAELVLIEGDGFKADPTYTVGTESYGEKHPFKVTLTPQGHFAAAVTPWIPGHDSGDTVVYYQSSTCTPTVSFHWGKDTYKPE